MTSHRRRTRVARAPLDSPGRRPRARPPLGTEARSLRRSLQRAELEVKALSLLWHQYLVTPASRRQLARDAVQLGVSTRRACALFRVPRSMLGHSSRRMASDNAIVATLREILARQPRIGYRYALVLLRERGVRVNAKRLYRIWRDYGLSRRHAGPK